MKNELSKKFSFIIILVFFIGFAYVTVKAIQISNKTQVSTKEGIYTNKVSFSKAISSKALELIKGCNSEFCEVQRLLDYVTDIPYKINHFRVNSPQKTIQNNFGDCDDKSNLLISMLHSLKKEAYFVLVPKHIFVITPLEDVKLHNTKGLIINKKKYYILESTAKGSQVGFPLRYELNEISAIVEPFSNQPLKYDKLKYDL
jgi:hypothetical protein